MPLPVFPTLAGQGWSVHKRPSFSTTVADHASGREVRRAKWLNPRWSFELTFEGLDSTDGTYGSLGASSLQTLMGFFMQVQGSANPFLYFDPSDYQVSGQVFGTGDGATRSFQLSRALGGGTEWITQPLDPSTPYLLSLAGSPSAYVSNNVVLFSADMTNGAWSSNAVTISGGVSDPFGGTSAQTITSNGAGGSAWVFQNPAPVGTNYVSSVWARRRTGTGTVRLADPSHDGVVLNMPLTSTWQRFSISGPPSGFAFFLVQLMTVGDAVDLCRPQLEVSLGSVTTDYKRTLGSPVYGDPQITVAGAIRDSSTYSIANGVVTFGSAPANGAELAWTGMFAFPCRFEDDELDFEEIMSGLWQNQSVKFRSVRAV
jgi:hypothetical protein